MDYKLENVFCSIKILDQKIKRYNRILKNGGFLHPIKAKELITNWMYQTLKLIEIINLIKDIIFPTYKRQLLLTWTNQSNY
tara:strand:- start:11104 stop:11346 length:243 start_codon:yes stop_codon:yes gene_type:complete